ncbi:extracellular solute-binding protein [Devosia sp. MC532]|uniref:ABC transporter substrate-binding protein n=1 Tax=Devosia sp. MC532 TaxID=2799788 RepID=UPI0018F54247|nr:extracellular solute-binding protein [Devosia sp. MC532]MBJ7578440.1 extracellular solute-binding protein [Devosia sp. MC532]
MNFKLNRRGFLKAGAATLATGLAMPALIGRAHAAGVVNIVGHDSYVPKDLREKFTQETGIVINLRSTTDQSQIFNLLAAEGDQRQTDMSIIAGHRMFAYIATDYLAEIDESKLPGMSKINPVYRDADAQFIQGKRYGIPVLTGFAMMASRKGVVAPEDTETWETIFGDKYAGRVTLRPGSALYAAMFHLGLQDVWTGYNGDSAAVEAMLKECREYAISRKHVLRKWYDTTAEFQQLYFGNEIDAGMGFTETAMLLAGADSSVQPGIPVEGTTGWTYNYSLFKNSANQENTYKFIDFLLQQESIGSSMTRSSGSLSTFLDATSGLTEAEAQAIQFSDEQLKRITWLDVKGADDNRYGLLDQYGAGLREA